MAGEKLELVAEFLVQCIVGGSHQSPSGTILPALVSLGALAPCALVVKSPLVPPAESVAVGHEALLGIELGVEWLTLKGDLTDKSRGLVVGFFATLNLDVVVPLVVEGSAHFDEWVLCRLALVSH